MSNSHYYDRTTKQVIKRLPQHPDKIAGANSGRQQRKKDKERSLYPRESLPISRAKRSPQWITAYQQAYYQPKSTGAPMLGDCPRVSINVTCDRTLLDALDSAGYSRALALEIGIKTLLDTLVNCR